MRLPVLLFFLLLPLMLQGQQSLDGTGKIRVYHRYDLRIKTDGKYQGLFYGGGQGLWTWTDPKEVQALYFWEEQGLRDTRYTEKKVSEDLRATFSWNEAGRMGNFQGTGVPLFRNFPYHPPEVPWTPGGTWVSEGEFLMDWEGNGQKTAVPILTEYKILGLKNDSQGEYWEVSALHALRYRGAGGLSIQGRHESLIQWPAGSRLPRFFRMKVDEEIRSAGKTLSRSGFWLNWYGGIIPMESTVVKKDLEKTLQDSHITDVTVVPADEGIKLVLKNLQFVADKAVFLPGEQERLNVLAEMLKKIPRRTLVITGHTAEVGRPQEQDELSEQRALAVVEELKTRGIPPERLLYRGRGAREPLGDNGTPEGRALNRRVEITILED